MLRVFTTGLMQLVLNMAAMQQQYSTKDAAVVGQNAQRYVQDWLCCMYHYAFLASVVS